MPVVLRNLSRVVWWEESDPARFRSLLSEQFELVESSTFSSAILSKICGACPSGATSMPTASLSMWMPDTHRRVPPGTVPRRRRKHNPCHHGKDDPVRRRLGQPIATFGSSALFVAARWPREPFCRTDQPEATDSRLNGRPGSREIRRFQREVPAAHRSCVAGARTVCCWRPACGPDPWFDWLQLASAPIAGMGASDHRG